MVTWENYEEYMMLHADGELQAAKEQELMAFVAQHPELKGELELCAAVKLTPDTAVVYANKDALMKPVPATKKVIAIPVWQRYAIAAGVAAIICLSVLKFSSLQLTVDNRQLAVDSRAVGGKAVGSRAIGGAVVSGSQSGVGSKAADSRATGSKAVSSKAVAGKTVAIKKDVNKDEVILAADTKYVRKQEVISKEAVQGNAVVYEQIAAITPVETKVLPVASESVKFVAVNSIPVANVNVLEDSKKTLFESLPIEDIKKDGMADMASALAQTYKKMSALKRNITDEKNISVRVEKKQLIVSF